MNMKLPTCPYHPDVFLPRNFTCPLCAQEARQRAYAEQQAEAASTLHWTARTLPRPATDPSGDKL